jgi:aldehyde dehydrogenase (NAD+)
MDEEHLRQFYINGKWISPTGNETLDVIDPSTETPFVKVAMGSAKDVDHAVAAARTAFPAFAQSTRAARIELLSDILGKYEERLDEIASTISREMGCPITLAREQQAPVGVAHLKAMIDALKTFPFVRDQRGTLVVREAIGVAGLITPWNWPINQIVCKVAPAIAAGCTMVLKPSEVAPLNAIVFTEILHDAGVPKGVFNLVHGDGPTVGAAISSHPGIDMVSFTGSTRAGIQVAQNAAPTVKRVSQELGGKSANILLPDVDLEPAVEKGINACWLNSGQSCNAPTRMLVPAELEKKVIEIAKQVASRTVIGRPSDESAYIGPVVSRAQFEKIQGLIEGACQEGACLVTGGAGKPGGLETGYFVKPTIFAKVTRDMTIAKEEVFGPVLTIIPYKSEQDAIELANDTPFGLAAYVQSTDLQKARRIADRMRAGQVYINYPTWDLTAPFGGYKQSGNGREFAEYGLEEFLETKAILGAPAIAPELEGCQGSAAV